MIEIGEYRISAIDTGRFRLDGGAMFGVVPKILWQKHNPADAENRIAMAARSILIQGKGRTMLVDAGIGSRWAERQRAMYCIEHEDAALDKALQEHGVRRGDVTDVVLTHLHFDHVGAATREPNAGAVELTFPRARFLVQSSQLDHARKPSEKDRASFRDELLSPLEEHKLLDTLSGPTTIAPGIDVIVTNGHTHGHQAVRISSGGKTLVFTGDAIPTATHIPVPWVMGYDLYPMLCLEEKRELLAQAARDKWVLAWCHDPFRAASTVEVFGDRYRAGADVAL